LRPAFAKTGSFYPYTKRYPALAGGFAMDRIALALIASGLVLILSIVVAVLGGTPSHALPGYAAAGAALSGSAIVAGLALLERRAFATGRRV
jgi:hypothetical protein